MPASIAQGWNDPATCSRAGETPAPSDSRNAAHPSAGMSAFIAKSVGRFAVERHGWGNVIDRNFQSTRLISNDTQQLHGNRLLGIQSQNLSTELLGGLKLSATAALDSPGQDFGNYAHDRFCGC